MKKKVVNEFLEIFKKSYEKEPKKLDAEWRAIHAAANVLLHRYDLYRKVRKKKGKRILGLQEWIDVGKPEK